MRAGGLWVIIWVRLGKPFWWEWKEVVQILWEYWWCKFANEERWVGSNVCFFSVCVMRSCLFLLRFFFLLFREMWSGFWKKRFARRNFFVLWRGGGFEWFREVVAGADVRMEGSGLGAFWNIDGVSWRERNRRIDWHVFCWLRGECECFLNLVGCRNKPSSRFFPFYWEARSGKRK